MVEKRERRGLGRGLSALMADVEPQPQADAETSVAARADRVVPIDQIVPNPDQPRRRFSEEQLDELTESIRAKGIIQPIIVREKPDAPNQFEIVAGERRWRAAQRAQLHEIPVLVREFSDTEVLEVAIIENIQRADLNAIEEAAGFRQLMFKFGHTQEKLAEALGKSRSHIANLMRLLNLPEDVQTYVSEGRLSAGHARALITASDPSALAKTVIARNLSVRETEKLAKGEANRVENRKAAQRWEGDREGCRHTGARKRSVGGFGHENQHRPQTRRRRGRLTISYDTLDQLDALCGILST